MSKIKNAGLDQYALNPSNSSNLKQLALKGSNGFGVAKDQISDFLVDSHYVSVVVITTI